MANPRSERAQKLTYVAVGIGAVLGIAAQFLPAKFQWFMGGIVVGVFVALGLVFSDLFYKPTKKP